MILTTDKLEIGNGNPDGCKADEYVALINPWSKVLVDTPISEIIENGLNAYPWPENVLSELRGMCDSDEEFVTRAVEMMGTEQAGIVIIGS